MDGGRQSIFWAIAPDQFLSDHLKTARQAAKPPIAQMVSTRNMCQCSQLPAGSKAAIFDGSSTDRNPWAIHLTGKIDPTANIHVGNTISGASAAAGSTVSGLGNTVGGRLGGH